MSERDPRPYKCPHPKCGWTFSRQEHQVSMSRRCSPCEVADRHPPIDTSYAHAQWRKTLCLRQPAVRVPVCTERRTRNASAIDAQCYKLKIPGHCMWTVQCAAYLHVHRARSQTPTKLSIAATAGDLPTRMPFRRVPGASLGPGTFTDRTLRHCQREIYPWEPLRHSARGPSKRKNRLARASRDINASLRFVILYTAAPSASI